MQEGTKLFIVTGLGLFAILLCSISINKMGKNQQGK
jgi:hypothetical protein